MTSLETLKATKAYYTKQLRYLNWKLSKILNKHEELEALIKEMPGQIATIQKGIDRTSKEISELQTKTRKS